MRSTATRILLVALALSMTGAAFAASKADPNRARVQRLGKAIADAYGRGDIAGLGRMYTEDAMIFPPESEALKGRPAIEGFWKGAQGLGIKSIAFEALDVESSGNFIVDTGKANMTVQGAGPGTATVSVKYVVVWKKQKDGNWKVHRDIWNSLPGASPAAAPPPAATPTPAPHH